MKYNRFVEDLNYENKNKNSRYENVKKTISFYEDKITSRPSASRVISHNTRVVERQYTPRKK